MRGKLRYWTCSAGHKLLFTVTFRGDHRCCPYCVRAAGEGDT